MKNLIEKRNHLLEQMEQMIATAENELRALTAEETATYDSLKSEVEGLSRLIDEKRALASSTVTQTPVNETVEQREEREFTDYILGRINEMRAGEQNVTMANNAAIIPVTIANRIIKAVKDRCPIFERATLYAVKGVLKVPVWGNTANGHNIAVGYQTEFVEITADAGAFTSVDLGGYLAGALTLIGRSVENNASFNVTEFIINQMAEEIAAFLEKELLTGSGSNAATGALSTTNTLEAASATAVTTDELMELQSMVKQAYQANACWTMSSATFLAIKKLKDGNNRYLLQDDITGEFPYRLLGKPVYISDNMPAMGAGAKAILYGDYTGLSVNMRENISIEVLREKYATQHAIGVIAWFEFDSKVTEPGKLAVLTGKSASAGA